MIIIFIPPAEDTLVSAGETGGGFHAAVRLNAIEGVFVAASSSSQHWLKQENNSVSALGADVVLGLSKALEQLLSVEREI